MQPLLAEPSSSLNSSTCISCMYEGHKRPLFLRARSRLGYGTCHANAEFGSFVTKVSAKVHKFQDAHGGRIFLEVIHIHAFCM